VPLAGLRATPAIERLAREAGPLAQPDGGGIDPAALREVYGVRARLLAPVAKKGVMIGWLEAHADVPRAWSKTDIAAIADTAAEVRGIIGG
jgi:maleate isomerase